MNIGIVTDSIREQSTGIGFYTKNVVSKILNLDKINEYYFIDYLKTSFNQDKYIEINNPFMFFKIYLWHNYIPLKSHNFNLDLIFNFSGIPHLFRFKQKEIFFVHDISWYFFPDYHAFSTVIIYKLFFKTSLKNCFKIAVVSLSTKNDLIKYFNIPKEKIYVIYIPYKQPTIIEKKPKINLKDPYILFVGTLEPRKNIETLIKAYKKIQFLIKPYYKLIICGKMGWKYSEIFSLTQELNLENEVLFTGYVSDKEKKYLFKHAEFLVYPSFYEGFGLPVLEAMSLGCPVITSNQSSLPEVAGKAGILINPNNVSELVESMIKLIGNKELRLELKRKGFIQAKKFSNNDNFQLFIESLIKS